MRQISFILLVCAVFMIGCSENTIPKPTGYFHIELPQQKYTHFTSACPFEFEVSTVAEMVPKDSNSNNCFYNLEYPQWKATVHLSYLAIKNDLKELIDEEHRRKEKHIQLASSIEDSIFVFPDRKVSATIFNINGTKTATPLQFFITDSTQHFFRGALYFYHSPNNDSIAPIIGFIKRDIKKLIGTFNWK